MFRDLLNLKDDSVQDTNYNKIHIMDFVPQKAVEKSPKGKRRSKRQELELIPEMDKPNIEVSPLHDIRDDEDQSSP